MSRYTRIFLATVLFATFGAFTAQAAIYCKNCSTQFIQALDRVTNVEQLTTLVRQYQQAVQQTQQQIAMVQNMLQNTASLGPNMIGELKGQLSRLAQLTSSLRTQRGDITALGEVFQNLFPEQSQFEDIAGASPEQTEAATQRYRDHWDTWSKSVDEASQATFQLSGQQLDDLQKDPARFQQYMDDLLSTPDGQMQAIQAGNQLAAIQVQEARQLRELMATNIQSALARDMKTEKEAEMSEELWRDATKTNNLKGVQSKSDPF